MARKKRENPLARRAERLERLILRDAGYTPAHARRSLQTLDDALSANHTVCKYSNGKVIDERDEPAWEVRIRAAHEILAMGGAFRESSQSQARPMIVVMHFGNPDNPPIIDASAT